MRIPADYPCRPMGEMRIFYYYKYSMDTEKAIDALKLKVEEKLGRKLATPSDFNRLILRMQEETGEMLALSTLKRVWRYVPSPHQASAHTLSCLAQFAGYTDWSGYIAAYSGSGEIDSDFLTGKQIVAETLRKGDEVEFGWEPDRYCRVVCIGNGVFLVVESRNGKLRRGDTFRASVFSLGLPFYAANVCREGKKLESYIAGRRKGLNLLNKLTKSRE